MNRFLVLIPFLLVVSAIPLRANGITDPNMGLDDPTPCVEGCPNPVGGHSGTVPFTFTADANGGGITIFTTDPNGPGFNTVDIETIDPVITSSTQVGCFSNVFFCTVRILGGVTDVFFQPDAVIPAGIEFAINLNLSAGTCNPLLNDCSSTGPQGWNPGELFTAFPNINQPTTPLISAPEPSTISLLGVGMLGLLARKRKKLGDFLRSV